MNKLITWRTLTLIFLTSLLFLSLECDEGVDPPPCEPYPDCLTSNPCEPYPECLDIDPCAIESITFGVSEVFPVEADTIIERRIETVEIDSFYTELVIVPVDTIQDYGILQIAQPDSLIIYNSMDEPIDTLIVESNELSEIDSMAFEPPDSLFLFDFAVISIENEVFDTTIVEESSRNVEPVTVSVCPTDYGDELDDIQAFIEYILQSWNIEEIVHCDTIDISDSFSDLYIQFSLSSVSPDRLVLNYFSSRAYPLFSTTGTLTFNSQDFSANNVLAVRDDGIEMRLDDLIENIENGENIDFELLEFADCDVEIRSKSLNRRGIRCGGRRRKRAL